MYDDFTPEDLFLTHYITTTHTLITASNFPSIILIPPQYVRFPNPERPVRLKSEKGSRLLSQPTARWPAFKRTHPARLNRHYFHPGHRPRILPQHRL